MLHPMYLQSHTVSQCWGRIALNASYVTITRETNNEDHNILTIHSIYSRGHLTQASNININKISTEQLFACILLSSVNR